jgi:hypothetical protein
MKKQVIFITFFIFSCSIFSQDKIFDLKDIFTSSKMYPQSLRQLQWIPNTHDFVYVKDNDLVKATAPSDKASIWVSLSDINTALEGKGEKELKAFPVIVYWTSTESCYMHAAGKIIQYQV